MKESEGAVVRSLASRLRAQVGYVSWEDFPVYMYILIYHLIILKAQYEQSFEYVERPIYTCDGH